MSISNFLNEINTIHLKYKELYDQQEKFNIFKALHHHRDEVRLHSRFISVLLNPKGSHNLKDFFLCKFIETVYGIDTDLSLGEYHQILTLPDEYRKSEYKNFDVFLTNRELGKCIIIENKIDAGESNHEDRGQIEGYYDRILLEEKIKPENIHLIYLTLDGKEPSEISMGKYEALETINGVCASYEIQIINWLENCLENKEIKSFLRESIEQYIRLLKEMTHNEANITHRKELLKVISSSVENSQGFKELIENQEHIIWHAVDDFFNSIYSKLEDKGFNIEKKHTLDSLNYLAHNQRLSNPLEANKILVKKNEVTFSILYDKVEYLFFAIENNLNAEIKSDDLTFTEFSNQKWFISKDFFEVQEDKIYFGDFKHKGTFDIINNETRESKANEIVAELEETLMKLRIG